MNLNLAACDCASHNQHVEITIPDNEWTDSGPDDAKWARISGPALIVNGVHLHLEAVAVEFDENDCQVAAAGDFVADTHDALVSIFDTAFQTVSVRGREYVTYLIPHGM